MMINLFKDDPWDNDAPQLTPLCRHIAVASSKGGPGKTLVGWQLGTSLVLAGYKVIFADGDSQETMLETCQIRNKLVDNGHPIPRVRAMKFKHQEKGVEKLKALVEKSKPDYIIYDVGGSANQELAMVLSFADLIISPLGTSAADRRALIKLRKIIHGVNQTTRKANNLNSIHACLLGNKILTVANSIENRRHQNFMNAIPETLTEFQALSHGIKQSTRLVQATDDGLNIAEKSGNIEDNDSRMIAKLTEFVMRGGL